MKKGIPFFICLIVLPMAKMLHSFKIFCLFLFTH